VPPASWQLVSPGTSGGAAPASSVEEPGSRGLGRQAGGPRIPQLLKLACVPGLKLARIRDLSQGPLFGEVQGPGSRGVLEKLRGLEPDLQG